MIAQNIDFTVNHLIERRTRVYGQLKMFCCGINGRVRAREIHELSGLNTIIWFKDGHLGPSRMMVN
jgi:hypothetical protein